MKAESEADTALLPTAKHPEHPIHSFITGVKPQGCHPGGEQHYVFLFPGRQTVTPVCVLSSQKLLQTCCKLLLSLGVQALVLWTAVKLLLSFAE